MYQFFFLMGLILLFGFFSQKIFEKTGVSETILLMLAGFFIGPLFNLIDASAGSVIFEISGFMAVFALILLLFDGALGFDIFDMLRVVPTGVTFTIVTFVATLLLVAGALVGVFGWSAPYAVILGATVGGTSSAIVLAMSAKAKVREDTKAFLAIESTLTDALCIIVAFTAIKYAQSGPVPLDSVPGAIFGSISTGLLVGSVFAFVWIFFIGRLLQEKTTYILTLSIAFIAYAISEFLNGNGGIAVFAFGLLLGNAKKLFLFFNRPLPFEYSADYHIRSTQSEMSFFVRTFFFVYLGILLSPSILVPSALVLAAVALAGIFVARYLCVQFFSGMMNLADRRFIVAMLPRGLAAAVLAANMASTGITIPFFNEIVLLTILSTNVVATVGLFDNFRAAASAVEAAAKQAAQSAAQDAKRATAPRVLAIIDNEK